MFEQNEIERSGKKQTKKQIKFIIFDNFYFKINLQQNKRFFLCSFFVSSSY